MAIISLQDRYLGTTFGLAVGDAIGTTVEFAERGSFPPVTDMVGGGPFGLLPGQWTDDTSMALCLAESLIETGKNDVFDQMRRYVMWWRSGHLSSTGHCFDIGVTTRNALREYVFSGNPQGGSVDPYSAGNGSLMRLAPIPLAYRMNVDAAIEAAADSSRTTHGAREAVDACRLFTVLLILALRGESKDRILRSTAWEETLTAPTHPLATKINDIVQGSFKKKPASDISASGYVVESLEAALWSFYTTDNFDDAVLAATNLGDDADTTAAICGQIAGAYYGINGIRKSWRERVALNETIERFAKGLSALSETIMFDQSE